ncbi:MAG: hypothetical protein ACYTKD_19395, partial [Planctomycetota bacterium]
HIDGLLSPGVPDGLRAQPHPNPRSRGPSCLTGLSYQPLIMRAAHPPPTVRSIDELVYDLYGLTDREVRIVEEATAG